MTRTSSAYRRGQVDLESMSVPMGGLRTTRPGVKFAFARRVDERADDQFLGAGLNAERIQPCSMAAAQACDIALARPEEEFQPLLRGKFDEGRKAGHGWRGVPSESREAGQVNAMRQPLTPR